MCDPGYKRSNRDCYKCPRNTYSDGGNMTTCYQCPDNKYSSEGSSTCSYGSISYFVTIQMVTMLPSLYRSTISNPYIFTRKLSVKCNGGYRVGEHTSLKCPKNTFSRGIN